MSLKVGVYEFFARLIPGGFYLFVVGYLCILLKLVTIDLQTLNNFSVSVVIVAAIVAYILGYIFDPFALLWFRMFKSKNFSKIVLEEFKKMHSELELNIQDKDWPIVLAYLRNENLEVVNALETYNATSIMFRNISFGFGLLMIIQIVKVVQAGINWQGVLSIVLVLVVSLITGWKSTIHRRWFYAGIYEAIIARGLEPAHWIKRRTKAVIKLDKVVDTTEKHKRSAK